MCAVLYLKVGIYLRIQFGAKAIWRTYLYYDDMRSIPTQGCIVFELTMSWCLKLCYILKHYYYINLYITTLLKV